MNTENDEIEDDFSFDELLATFDWDSYYPKHPEIPKLVLTIADAHVEFCTWQNPQNYKELDVGLTALRYDVEYSLCGASDEPEITGALESVMGSGPLSDFVDLGKGLLAGKLDESYSYDYDDECYLDIEFIRAGENSYSVGLCDTFVVVGPEDYLAQNRIELVGWNARSRGEHIHAVFIEFCGKDAEYLTNYFRLAAGELNSDSPEIQEMLNAGILIGSTEEAKTHFDEEKIAQVVEEFCEHPFWREVYETAPSDGCKRRIALSYYYTDCQNESLEVNMADMKLEQRRLERGYTIADWKHLGRYCGNNPLRSYFYGKAKELEERENENNDELQ